MNDARSLFWSDLEDDLTDAESFRQFIVASARVDAVDRVMNALDDARIEAGLSKAALARATGQEAATIRRLFSAARINPTLGTLAEIAVAVGLRVTVEPLDAKSRELFARVLVEGQVDDVEALRAHVLPKRPAEDLT